MERWTTTGGGCVELIRCASRGLHHLRFPAVRKKSVKMGNCTKEGEARHVLWLQFLNTCMNLFYISRNIKMQCMCRVYVNT